MIQVVDTPVKQKRISPADAPLEQVEVLLDKPRGQSLVMIEESVLERGGKSFKALGLEEEAQTVSPPVTSSRAPTFLKTLLDSSLYYERLRKKRPALTTAGPLTWEGHPFFEGLPTLPEIMKSFYDELLSTEGNIFQKCPVGWPVLRTVIISGLFESVCSHEKYMIVDVPTDILKEVAEVTVSAARMGVKVEWMDETLGRIVTKRRHLNLLEDRAH